MRIKRVQFKNYRCFLDEEVKLPDRSTGKNIDLFIAPNGGGKTEFLFSIWWALYPDSFNFNDLKGKEATNYSLNSDLYLQIANGSYGSKKECFVEIEFENENITYVLKRKESYEKNSIKKPLVTQSCSLYKVDKNGIATTPITDDKEIKGQLERIIPQKVLSGIIFDGERMKKISSIDSDSIKSIEGVISDITNKEVLLTLETELTSFKNYYQRKINKFAQKLKYKDLEEVGESILHCEKEIKDTKSKLIRINNNIPALEQKINKISEELKALEASKNIENELTASKAKLTIYETNYEKDLVFFRNQLSKEGSYIIINKLVKDLETVINSTNVPLGLNVKIVENILTNDHCICGHEMTPDMRYNLKELNKKLPPNDINATIKEKAKNVQSYSKKAKLNIKNFYNSMNENYKNIIDTKQEITSLKTLLTESVSGKVGELENQRGKYEEQLLTLLNNKNVMNTDIQAKTNELNELLEGQKKLIEQEKQLTLLQSQKEFIEKSLKAIKTIQEKYRTIALGEINTLFRNAYKEISEDYINGRRAYLTHISSNKYVMQTYNDTDLIRYMEDIKGFSEEDVLGNSVPPEELEKAIDQIKISNSTGQQTVLSLAFVKAMLDYSRKESNNSDKELKKVKSYPVVIDAPFSDLSGENLENASSSINFFSEQVLLLINNDSYKNIQGNIGNYINSIHIFHKIKDKQCSKISEGGTLVE